MEQEKLVKIEVHSVKEITIKDDNGKVKNKFLAYKAVKKDGKLIDLKFTTECELTPDEPCYILVKPENFNVAKNQKYPCVWVKEVEEITPFETKPNDEDIF